jgi:hypothetical protein
MTSSYPSPFPRPPTRFFFGLVLGVTWLHDEFEVLECKSSVITMSSKALLFNCGLLFSRSALHHLQDIQIGELNAVFSV